jgi:hypothetical protein
MVTLTINGQTKVYVKEIETGKMMSISLIKSSSSSARLSFNADDDFEFQRKVKYFKPKHCNKELLRMMPKESFNVKVEDHQLFLKTDYQVPSIVYIHDISKFKGSINPGTIYVYNYRQKSRLISFTYKAYHLDSNSYKLQEGELRLKSPSAELNLFTSKGDVEGNIARLKAAQFGDLMLKNIYDSCGYKRSCPRLGKRLTLLPLLPDHFDLSEGLNQEGLNLSKSYLHGAYAQNIKIKGVDFTGAKMTGMLFEDVVFEDCIFTNSSWVNTRVNNVKFINCTNVPNQINVDTTTKS